MGLLVIEETSVYELDEECMRNRKLKETGESRDGACDEDCMERRIERKNSKRNPASE